MYDITGAGDMVMAMIGLCLASGTDPADAVRLGNVAAGLEVERTGVAVIYRDEIRGRAAAGSRRPGAQDRHAANRPPRWPKSIGVAARRSCSPTAASTCCTSDT